ncbi:thioredoxin-dependent peroxidase [Coprinopsis sp. MPI-PUGE-AT-0042]|nr:thioredoxin-dependent peroxidase [Coprinopsis sp. MPI-PUGE-AT-0042]
MSQVGSEIPSGSFKYVPWTPELEDHLTCGAPVAISTDEWKDKKLVVVSVPGAFTPTCHANHLPPYIQFHEEFKKRGVDVIAVLAVNDAWVMSGWARVEGAKDKILALSDTNASWSKKLGLVADYSHADMGFRTARYALVLENNIIRYRGVEKSDPSLPESGAQAVLDFLDGKKKN